jgi:hypothetical membrane protein
MKKNIYLIGIITPLLYIFSVILGGALWPGYSHVTQAISELTMASAPNLGLMDSLFTAYGLLLLVFSAGFAFIWRKSGNKGLAASGIVLVCCALAGLLMKFFRQDPIGEPLTFTGFMHLILAALTSLGTIFAIFLSASGFRKLENTRGLRTFALVMGVIVLISGGLTAVGTTQLPAVFGILERITIGSFMLWLLVISIALLYQDSKHTSKK